MLSKPSIGSLGSLLAVPGLSGVAAAQSTGAGAGIDPALQIVIRFGVGAAILTIFGVAAVAIGPKYTQNKVREIQRDPGAAFGWGLLVGVLVPIGLVLLVLTVIGALISIPGLLLIAILSFIGTGVTVVWVGNAVIGDDGQVSAKDGVAGALLLAVPFAIPIVGGFLLNLITLAGLGVVGQGVYEDWSD